MRPSGGPATAAGRLADLSRKDLIDLAKKHGIKANQKSSLIVAELQELLSEFDDSIDVDSNSNSIDEVLVSAPPPAPPAPPAFKASTKRQKDLPLSPRNQAQMTKYRERQQIARRELDAPPQAAFGHASQDTHSRVPPSTTKEKVAPFKANTKKQKAMELSDRNKRQMEKFRERQMLARTGETKKAAFGHGTQATKSRTPLGTAPNGSLGGGGGSDGSTLDDASSFVSASSSQSSSTAGIGAAGAVKGNKKKAVPAWKVASRDFRRTKNAGVTAQAIGPAKSAAVAFGHGVSETKSRLPTTTSSSGGEDEKETAKTFRFRANTRKLKTMEMTERNRKQMEKFRQRQMAGREERMKKAALEKEIMCSRD